MKKINISMEQKNLWHLATYGVIILLIVILGIVPLYFKNAYHVTENKKLEYQIKEQKELGPIYTTLLNNMKSKNSYVLPNPEKTTMPRSEAGKFRDDFQMIAKRAGLKIASFTPDFNTSAGTSTSFLHNVVLKGDFAGFRKILIGLGEVPYLDRIEEISIQQGADLMEFRMKIWIAIK